MNIYATKGHRVRFANPTSGYQGDQDVCKKYLVEGQWYTIESTDVGSSHTTVFLQEFPNVWFNSVMFSDSTDDE